MPLPISLKVAPQRPVDLVLGVVAAEAYFAEPSQLVDVGPLLGVKGKELSSHGFIPAAARPDPSFSVLDQA